MRRWRGLVGLLVAAGLLGAGPAGAEVRRLEVVGAVPADPDRAPGQPLAQAALTEALDEAVERVARGLLVGPDGSVPAFDAASVLGKEATDYAISFRILEDRGERRALLVTEPGVTREYVVLVEVQVDVDRVRERLRQAGFALGEGEAGTRRFRLEALEIASPRAYAAIRAALLEQAGADEAIPVEIERGRAVFQVRAPAGEEATLQRLLGADLGEGLSLEALPSSPGDVLVRVRETAAPPPLEGPGEPPARSAP